MCNDITTCTLETLFHVRLGDIRFTLSPRAADPAKSHESSRLFDRLSLDLLRLVLVLDDAAKSLRTTKAIPKRALAILKIGVALRAIRVVVGSSQHVFWQIGSRQQCTYGYDVPRQDFHVAAIVQRFDTWI